MTTVEYTPESAKELSKLDRQAASRIRAYMGEVGKLADPRSRGKGLTSNLSGLWFMIVPEVQTPQRNNQACRELTDNKVVN